MRKGVIAFVIVLLLNVFDYSDGKETNPILEEFKKHYSIITEACRAVGYVKNNCSKDQKQKVAFTAAVTSHSTTWNSGTLIFNSVISNVGNGYNQRTGVFTAPMAGAYVFFINAAEYQSQNLGLDIVLNNVSKVRLLAYKSAPYQTGTNMAVLNLHKGDSVWVIHHAGKGYWTQNVPLTTFSGFMI